MNFWAIDKATAHAGPQVEDLILSNFPAVEVDGLFVNGTFIVVAFAFLIVLTQPKSIPFVLHGLTLLSLIHISDPTRPY